VVDLCDEYSDILVLVVCAIWLEISGYFREEFC